MQELKNDTFKNQLIKNGYNSSYQGKTFASKRFIECVRCGKLIKNDLKVIKNHEYYCLNKELATRGNEISEPAFENEHSPYEYADDSQMLEQATEEPVSGEEAEDNTGSISGIILIGIVASIIGAIIIVYKILAQKNQPTSSITLTSINEQKSSTQSMQIMPKLPNSLPY